MRWAIFIVAEKHHCGNCVIEPEWSTKVYTPLGGVEGKKKTKRVEEKGSGRVSEVWRCRQCALKNQRLSRRDKSPDISGYENRPPFWIVRTNSLSFPFLFFPWLLVITKHRFASIVSSEFSIAAASLAFLFFAHSVLSFDSHSLLLFLIFRIFCQF